MTKTYKPVTKDMPEYLNFKDRGDIIKLDQNDKQLVIKYSDSTQILINFATLHCCNLTFARLLNISNKYKLNMAESGNSMDYTHREDIIKVNGDQDGNFYVLEIQYSDGSIIHRRYSDIEVGKKDFVKYSGIGSEYRGILGMCKDVR